MTDIITPLTSQDTPLVARPGLARKLLRNPMGLIPLLVILTFIVVSIFANMLAPNDPAFVRLDLANAPPFESEFYLGGDAAGRDVLSRLLVAGQLSLLGAAVTVVVSVALGVTTGLIAGYFGGVFDAVVGWIANVILVLPSKVVLVALFAIVGPNTILTMAVLGVMLFPGFFRLVRNLVIGVKAELFVDAARVSGLSNSRIIGRHILGAVRAPIVIQSAFTAGIAVVIQAGLEFIGLGDPSTPTWGGMLQEAFVGIYTAPYLIIWPGITVGLFVASFVILGNSLRDALEGGIATKAPKRNSTRAQTDLADSGGLVNPHPLSEREADGALLIVEGLRVSYPVGDGEQKEVVKGISFAVKQGEVLGLVGESGSGKSQTAFAVLGLLPDEAIVSSVRMSFEKYNLNNRSRATTSAILGRKIAYIPQEPMSNLDPAYKIGYQLTEPMRALLKLSAAEAKSKALDLLAQVGITDPERTFNSYPHQISGGMAQRVLIAGAISCDPDLIIADEPTTALDVTIQAEVLDILRTLQKERGMAMVLVTHNFGVVADLCDRVIVMQDGELVERNEVEELFEDPQHPYTKMLLDSTLDGGEARPPMGSTKRHRLLTRKVES